MFAMHGYQLQVATGRAPRTLPKIRVGDLLGQSQSMPALKLPPLMMNSDLKNTFNPPPPANDRYHHQSNNNTADTSKSSGFDVKDADGNSSQGSKPLSRKQSREGLTIETVPYSINAQADPNAVFYTTEIGTAPFWYVAKRKQRLKKLEPVWAHSSGKKRGGNTRNRDGGMSGGGMQGGAEGNLSNNSEEGIPLTAELLAAMDKMSPVNQRGKEIRKLLSQHGGPFTAKAEGIKKVENEWKTVRQTTPVKQQRDQSLAEQLKAVGGKLERDANKGSKGTNASGSSGGNNNSADGSGAN